MRGNEIYFISVLAFFVLGGAFFFWNPNLIGGNAQDLTCKATATTATGTLTAAGTATSGSRCTTDLKRNRKSQLTVNHSAKPNPKSNFPNASDRWGVVTTIFEPSDSMVFLSKIAGWCVVIVLDKKAPASFEQSLNALGASCVVVLTPEMQRELTYRIVELTPWNHFGRKNIGFIYAVDHGAKTIYDFDDDNFLIPTGFPENPSQDKIFCPQYRVPAFNPYPAYGSESWPRGYPLPEIKNITSQLTVGSEDCDKKLLNVNSHYVVQSVANVDPDFDAIYRLTRQFPVFFAQKGRLVIPPGTLVPFNAQATLLKYETFWSLMLPITVHGRVSDIWRSYFMQPILWRIGGFLTFNDAFVDQFRNAHEYIRDFSSEAPLYNTVHCLIQFLLNWKPSPASSTDTANSYLELVTQAYEREFIEWEDVLVTHAYLQDLNDIGYKFPAMQPSFTTQMAAPRRRRGAVCLSGEMRSFSATLRGFLFRLNQLADADYDIYVSTPTGQNMAALLRHLKIRNSTDSSAAEEHTEIVKAAKSKFAGDNFEQYLTQAYDLWQCDSMISYEESIKKTPYDWIMRYRFDHILVQPLPPLDSLIELGRNAIVVPAEHNLNGYNNRFAFGNSQNMHQYMNLYQDIQQLMTGQESTLKPEDILKLHLSKSEITVVESPDIRFCEVTILNNGSPSMEDNSGSQSCAFDSINAIIPYLNDSSVLIH
jgi:hypothetical protein